jgi:ribonuclease P protein component
VPKHGHAIVDRNRLRRRLSELVRTELLAHLRQADVLFRATPAAYDASFDALREDVRTVRRRFEKDGG